MIYRYRIVRTRTYYGGLRCQDEILVARRQFARRFGVLLEIFVLWHKAKDVRLGLLKL